MVVADLIVGGASKGPHAFVVDFRVNGRLVDHIAVDDMGPKTVGDTAYGSVSRVEHEMQVGNDLDNAWIAFDNLELPKTALLSKHADVVISASIFCCTLDPLSIHTCATTMALQVNGKYELKSAGVRPFEMIGQRLYTGRVAVAQVINVL